MAFTLARVLVQFIGTGYISRIFSKNDLGLFVLFLALTRIGELFLVAGDNNVIIRDGKHFDWLGMKRQYLSSKFFPRLILVTMVTVGAFSLLSGFKGTTLMQVLILTCLFLLGRCCFVLCSGILVSNKKFGLFGLYDLLIIILSQLLFSRLFKGLGFTGLLTGYVLSYLMLALGYYTSGVINIKTDNRIKYSREDSWRFARPELLNFVSRSLDTYILPSIIGVELMISYKRGFSVGEVVTNTVGRSLAVVLFPSFSSMKAYERRKMGILFSFLAIIFGLSCSIIVSAYSQEIIHFYLGEGWEEAAKILSLVVYILPARLLAKVVGALLKASNLLKFFEITQYILIGVQLIALLFAVYDLSLFIHILILGTSLTILFQFIYWFKKSNKENININ